MGRRRSRRRSRSPIGIAILVGGLVTFLLLSDSGGKVAGEEVLARGPVLGDTDVAALREEAVLLRDEGRVEEAREQLASLAPDDPRTRYELGMTLVELERFDEAVTELEVATELAPDDAEIVFGLAQAVGLRAATSSNPLAQLAAGRRAKSLLDRAIELDGELVDARLGRMLFYMIAPSLMGGGLDRAREEAEAIAAVDETAGLFAKGWVAERDEDVERAEELLARAVESDESYAPARFRLGYLLLEQDRFDEALPHFEACGEHEPRDPRSYSGVGRCLLGVGRVKAAIAAHEHALALDGEHSASVLGLARCFDTLGDAPRARTEFERFLELRDDGDSADEARAWLADNDTP